LPPAEAGAADDRTGSADDKTLRMVGWLTSMLSFADPIAGQECPVLPPREDPHRGALDSVMVDERLGRALGNRDSAPLLELEVSVE